MVRGINRARDRGLGRDQPSLRALGIRTRPHRIPIQPRPTVTMGQRLTSSHRAGGSGWSGHSLGHRFVAPKWPMPIPADPVDTSDVAATVLTLFGQVHDQIRTEIEGLDADCLNWTPGPGTNSMATIVIHLVGSEAETLRSVAGIVDHRDRDAEFVQSRQTSAELADTLNRADQLIVEIGPQIDSGRLRARLCLPTLPDDERRSGLTWLVGNYGHAREHVGHIQLTRQLYSLV